MTRYEEYRLGETEERRVEGTAIGKAAVWEFVRGLELRESSPYEQIPKQEDRIAVAAWHFFKWLAEVPGYGCKENQSARILTVWEDEDGKLYSVSNMLLKTQYVMSDKEFAVWACRDMIIRLLEVAYQLDLHYFPVPKKRNRLFRLVSRIKSKHRRRYTE